MVTFLASLGFFLPGPACYVNPHPADLWRPFGSAAWRIVKCLWSRKRQVYPHTEHPHRFCIGHTRIAGRIRWIVRNHLRHTGHGSFIV